MSEESTSRGAVHLLYVAGDIKFERLEKALQTVPHIGLGPFTWLVYLPANGTFPFSEMLDAARAVEKLGQYERMLCPMASPRFMLSDSIDTPLHRWLRNVEKT